MGRAGARGGNVTRKRACPYVQPNTFRGQCAEGSDERHGESWEGVECDSAGVGKNLLFFSILTHVKNVMQCRKIQFLLVLILSYNFTSSRFPTVLQALGEANLFSETITGFYVFEWCWCLMWRECDV